MCGQSAKVDPAGDDIADQGEEEPKCGEWMMQRGRCSAALARSITKVISGQVEDQAKNRGAAPHSSLVGDTTRPGLSPKDADRAQGPAQKPLDRRQRGSESHDNGDREPKPSAITRDLQREHHHHEEQHGQIPRNLECPQNVLDVCQGDQVAPTTRTRTGVRGLRRYWRKSANKTAYDGINEPALKKIMVRVLADR